MADEPGREHARRTLGAAPARSFETIGPRLFRPLVGGAVGAAIVVLFLSLRGGAPIEAVDELTGTQRGGWNRLEDVHLLIVVNAAVVVAIAVNFAAEWVHHWLAVALAGITAGFLIAVRQLGDVGDAGSAALLALAILSVAAMLAIAAWDIIRIAHRSSY